MVIPSRVDFTCVGLPVGFDRMIIDHDHSDRVLLSTQFVHKACDRTPKAGKRMTLEELNAIICNMQGDGINRLLTPDPECEFQHKYNWPVTRKQPFIKYQNPLRVTKVASQMIHETRQGSVRVLRSMSMLGLFLSLLLDALQHREKNFTLSRARNPNQSFVTGHHESNHKRSLGSSRIYLCYKPNMVRTPLPSNENASDQRVHTQQIFTHLSDKGSRKGPLDMYRS